jgi:hypothetical protein
MFSCRWISTPAADFVLSCIFIRLWVSSSPWHFFVRTNCIPRKIPIQHRCKIWTHKILYYSKAEKNHWQSWYHAVHDTHHVRWYRSRLAQNSNGVSHECFSRSRHKRKFSEISGGAEHYLLITLIGTPVRNYLFQQGNLQSLTIWHTQQFNQKNN